MQFTGETQWRREMQTGDYRGVKMDTIMDEQDWVLMHTTWEEFNDNRLYLKSLFFPSFRRGRGRQTKTSGDYHRRFTHSPQS